MSKYKFDAKKETEIIINWIKDYFIRNGPECNAIVGISGGKDSTIVATLCAKALGRNRVIGVVMPNGKNNDSYYTDKVFDFLGIKGTEINIASICEAFYDETDITLPQVIINTPPRIRMAVLYAVAAAEHGRVACTENLSERYIGYSTKYGDLAGDFAPIQNYTVTELLAIGTELGIPASLLRRAPEDGLTGKTDEENFGFTYEELDEYIREKKYPDYEALLKIETLHKNNMHKFISVNLPGPIYCDF